MSFDTLFEITVNNKKFRMAGNYIAYDQYYSGISLDIISMLDKGICDAEKIGEQIGLICACDEECDDIDPTVEIDYDNKTVFIPKMKLTNISDFCREWDTEIICKDGKTYIKWGSDDDIELLVDVKERVDKIWPLLDKDVLTFDELKQYNEFMVWCEDQESSTFGYRADLVYHYEQM